MCLFFVMEFVVVFNLVCYYLIFVLCVFFYVIVICFIIVYMLNFVYVDMFFIVYFFWVFCVIFELINVLKYLYFLILKCNFVCFICEGMEWVDGWIKDLLFLLYIFDEVLFLNLFFLFNLSNLYYCCLINLFIFIV